MSITAMTWVFAHSEAKLGARLVLLVLADYAHDDGSRAYPSVQSIAAKARMSTRAVQEALRRLEADGHVEVMGRSQHGTTVYRILMGGADSAPPASGEVHASSSSPNPSSNPNPSSKGVERGSRVKAEPVGFAQWLGQHVAVAAKFGVEQSVPGAGTTRRARLAEVFARLLGEGHSLEDFRLASLGVIGSDFMREGGHVKPENVLRVEKFGGRVDDGRRVVLPEESKYARFDS